MRKFKKILKVVFIVIVCIVVIFAGYLGYCTITEWKPKAVEQLSVSNNDIVKKQVSVGDTLNLFTWNIGYAGMGENDSFFLGDGGTMVYPSKTDVTTNWNGIKNTIAQQTTDSDIIFLQEIDTKSTRSYNINQVQEIGKEKNNYNLTFALNLKTAFTPYPLPPYGFVTSGIASLTKFNIESAERVRIPNLFKWPIRLFQFKKSILVQKIPISGSDKKLVLVNTHFDAYTSNESRKEQVEAVKNYIEKEYKEGGNYVVLGGDFNEAFPGITWPKYEDRSWLPGEMLKTDFPDNWTILTGDNAPTNRSAGHGYIKGGSNIDTIDGFVLSPNIKGKSAEVLDHQFKYSDHNPVKLSFTLSK